MKTLIIILLALAIIGGFILGSILMESLLGKMKAIDNPEAGRLLYSAKESVNLSGLEIPLLGGKVAFYEDVNYVEINWKKEIFDTRFVRIDKYVVRNNGSHERDKILTRKTLNTGSWNGYWDKQGLADNEYIRIDVSEGSEYAIYLGGDMNEQNIRTLINKGKL